VRYALKPCLAGRQGSETAKPGSNPVSSTGQAEQELNTEAG